jgi:hypothetical protein
MSAFTIKTNAAAKHVREEAKRAALRTKLLKRQEVREAFEKIPPRLRRNASLHLSSYADAVHISLMLRNLESFKDKRLTNLLEAFIDWDAQVNEYTWGDPNKDFKFQQKYDGLEIHMTVYAYVKSDSPLCRIVVTGVTEKVVREEIKQIVCA